MQEIFEKFCHYFYSTVFKIRKFFKNPFFPKIPLLFQTKFYIMGICGAFARLQ